MDAIDLLNQTQTDFVSSSVLGTSEPIEYTHTSGLVVPDLRVFVELGEFNDSIADNKKVNTITIGNVILSETPNRTDKFTYDGITYKVREWTGYGIYQIYGDNGKRNKVSSRTPK